MSYGSDSGGRAGRAGIEGWLIGGRYRIAERIGSGGMGTVWRAHDELVDREVAVKQPKISGDPEDPAFHQAAERLYREARAAARVEHPAAVAIHDVVVEDGLPWIVMELVRGEALDKVLRRGALPPAESARIGLAVVEALSAAHSVGVIHRDVKPANVLLGQNGRVVLTDFGIAHILGEESLTASGEFVGSIEFIAPERMSGRGAGAAADLWSLGVVLYAAVEGWTPFRRDTLESTLAAILAAEPPEPGRAGPLGPLILRLLAKEPDRRPDASSAAATLRAVAEGRPAPDGPEPLVATQHGWQLAEFGESTGKAGPAHRPPRSHPLTSTPSAPPPSPRTPPSADTPPDSCSPSPWSAWWPPGAPSGRGSPRATTERSRWRRRPPARARAAARRRAPAPGPPTARSDSTRSCRCPPARPSTTARTPARTTGTPPSGWPTATRPSSSG
ncbi:serine/threonine-protein kinase [Streptomyces sp. NPDC020845]|uniref:serine/threonine-protein kinase n=1 Tax=Streptomyces sp. NPDC020845 TaxID=3365096 RepID=UPI0037AD7969